MFKIGQKVVCVKSQQRVIANKTYVISGLWYCNCSNHNQFIDIGLVLPNHKDGIHCAYCSAITTSDIDLYRSTHFRPLEYNTCHSELIEKFKSPEEVPDTKIKEPA